MSLSDLLVVTLATLYAAHAITGTHGAFGVFTWVRAHLPLGGLTSCIVCMAFWCALVFYGLWLTPLQPIVWIVATAGGAVFAARYVGMTNHDG